LLLHSSLLASTDLALHPDQPRRGVRTDRADGGRLWGDQAERHDGVRRHAGT
jgi:hypothetical protein